MDKSAEKRPRAWQPLTPRGVAAFAAASFGRLWLVQSIVAALAGLAVIWFLNRAWCPVFSAAIPQLPAQAEVRHARLNWPGPSPQLLAENRFLAITVDLRHEGQARSPAHVQVELGEQTIKVISILGFAELRYPTGWRIGLSRSDAEPWWGAWKPAVLAMTGAATLVSLMVVWPILAALYSGPAWLLAFFANRGGTWAGLWRLAQAALLPGALVLSLGIVLYGFGLLDLLFLFLAAGAHLVVGWSYLVMAIFKLPARQEGGSASPDQNPFAPSEPKKS
jgi:hypothetical protein